MPNPKQSGQPSGGMFQKYTGEQINQIPEGYVQGMGAMGQAYASIGQSIGKGIEGAAQVYMQTKANEAKIQGQLAPYLANTTSAVQQGLQSGTLVKDPNGKVGINEAAGIKPGMVDQYKLDFYNATGGDINNLTGSDLTKVSESFKSAQEIAKQDADRLKSSLDAKLTTAKIADLESKAAERERGAKAVNLLMQNIGNGIQTANSYNAGTNNNATPTVAGSVPTQQAPEVNTAGAFSQYVNQGTGTFGQPTTKPGQLPSYAGFAGYNASTQTSQQAPGQPSKPTQQLVKPSYLGFEEGAKATGVLQSEAGTGRAEYAKFVMQTSPTVPEMGRPTEQTGYGVRIDGTKKGAGWQGEIPTADGGVMTEKSIGVQIGGKEVLVPAITPNTTEAQKNYLASGANLIADSQAGKPIAKQIINDAVAHATPLIQQGKSPFAPAPNEPSPVKQAQAAAPTKAPVPVTESVVPPVAPTQTALQRVQALNSQRVNLIKERDAAVSEAVANSQSMMQLSMAVAQTPSTAAFGKLSFDYYSSLPDQIAKQYDSKLKLVDEQIKGIQTEESIKADTVKAGQSEIKAAQEAAKIEEDVLSAKEKDIAGHPNIGVMSWRFKDLSRIDRVDMGVANLSLAEINEVRSQYEGFVKAQGFLATLDDTLKARERGDQDYLARFRITSDSLDNWAKAQLADIFGVATFRKAIVSGGNFSDSDRIFVQKAIAYLNSIDPIDNNEVYRAKVNAVARFVNAMYMDGFKSKDYDFDPKVVEKTIATLRSKGLNDKADETQKSLDEINKFNKRFNLKPNSAGTSNFDDVQAARKELEEGVFNSKAAKAIPNTWEYVDQDGTKKVADIERSRSKYFIKSK